MEYNTPAQKFNGFGNSGKSPEQLGESVDHNRAAQKFDGFRESVDYDRPAQNFQGLDVANELEYGDTEEIGEIVELFEEAPSELEFAMMTGGREEIEYPVFHVVDDFNNIDEGEMCERNVLVHCVVCVFIILFL